MSTIAESLARKFEDNDKNGGKAWNVIFQNITIQSAKRAKSLKLATKSHFVSKISKRTAIEISHLVNDNCRITLGPEGNYINASPVSVASADKKYILCQGPLDETINDFWQMVWEQKVPTIVMLNKLIERGMNKCAAYYPTVDKPEMVLRTVKVSCEEEKEEEDVVCRAFTLSSINEEGQVQGESRAVQHIQYTQWPDFGVPRSPESFVHLLEVYWRLSSESSGPPVVHCSAGVGRSGTFVVVDSVISMAAKGVGSVDLEQLIVSLRESRMGLIQTPQQLRFSWFALVHYFASLKRDEKTAGRLESAECSEGEDGRKRECGSSSGSGSFCTSADQETLSKRRAVIAAMVARSREAEGAARGGAAAGGVAAAWLLPVRRVLHGQPRTLAVSVAVAALAFSLYYYNR